MGSLFKKPKMPPPPPPIPDPVPLPPTQPNEEFVSSTTGEKTTINKEAEASLKKKKKGYTNTILTSNKGVMGEANTYTKTLLGG